MRNFQMFKKNISPQGVASKLKQFIAAIFSLKFDTPISKLQSCDVLMFCHDGDRGAKKNGQRYAQLTDSLGDLLSDEGFKISTITIGATHIPPQQSYREPIALNRYMILYSLLRTIKLNNPANQVLKYAFDLCIKQSNCKVIVTQQAWTGLIAAARKNKTPVYLLIHGIGYPVLDESHKGKDPFDFPDYYLVLDQITSNTLSTIIPKDRIIPTAHPWLRQFEKSNSNHTEDWLVPQQLKKSLKNFKKVILVSLQYGYDGEDKNYDGILSNGILHEDIISAIKETEHEVAWIIRLHPRQLMKMHYLSHRLFVNNLQKQYKNVFTENIATIPLPSLLREIDGHITMISMTCYESAWCNVPSLVLCPTTLPGGINQNYFHDLVENAIIEKKEISKEVIIAWVLQTKKLKDNKNQIRYFNDKALEHIHQMITKISSF